MNASLRMSCRQAREHIFHWVARHLPHRLCYWAALHVAAEAGCYDEFHGEEMSEMTASRLISAYHASHLEN